MNWRNVRLIFAREIRDQLRDRRTLFMIAVLPLLLYPLLGMSVFQLSQFMRKHEARVAIVGAEQLSAMKTVPPLFVDGKLAPEVVGQSGLDDRMALDFLPLPESGGEQAADKSRALIDGGKADIVLLFPRGFSTQLLLFQEQVLQLRENKNNKVAPAPIEIPQPEILFNSANDSSRVSQMRLARLLEHWRALVARQSLQKSHVPINIARPFQIKPLDIAAKKQRDAVIWSKVLPFVLFVWALTGAFYPSVDLCAGEKERGTLETLLSSPALRSEIVWGKLLTIMTFSIATALLNLASLGITANFVISQMQSMIDFGAGEALSFPSLTSLMWLVLALVPMSAMFSALCLACAAFARSTKEGQYYIMPLFMITMPLMMLPMAPGAELTLGNSLIPVTGVVLLLRSLIEGHYAEALPFVIPVIGVTAMCCLFSIRWAIEIFQQESILFRESERLDLRRWVVHLVRDRSETPTTAQAFTCVALILIIQFFVNIAISGNVPAELDFGYLALVVFISQVVCIAVPALFMTMFLTSRPWKTLLLDRRPSFSTCLAAVGLALLLHPLGQQLALWIGQLYPISDDVVASSQMMMQLFDKAPYAWLPFVLIAVLPAICEELAFRGFILSGFRRMGHKWWAICLSALFFGMAHTVLQQSLAAFVVGMGIGFLAVQSGSLIPCILFHMTYNGAMLLSTRLGDMPDDLLTRFPVLKLAMNQDASEPIMIYSPALLIVCAILAAMIFIWLQRRPYQQSEAEQLATLRARGERHLPHELSP